MTSDPDQKYSQRYDSFISRLHACLQTAQASNREGQRLAIGDAMALWHSIGKAIRAHHVELYMIGNGASASMCSHYAVDLSKNAGLHARCFNDCALLTAMGNDICFEKVFSEALKLSAKSEDVLLAISSSGNSPNIIAGVEEARKIGMYTITLTGMSPDNKCRSLGDLNFHISAMTYGLVESAHAALLHFWTDMLIESRKEAAN